MPDRGPAAGGRAAVKARARSGRKRPLQYQPQPLQFDAEGWQASDGQSLPLTSDLEAQVTAGPLRSHTQRPGVPPGEIASAPVSAQGPLPALSSGASTSPLRPRRLDGAADASCNALADGHPRGRERGPSIGTRPSPSISRSRSRLGSTSVLPALRLPAIDTASRAIPTPQHMEHYLEHELAQLQPAGKREPQGR